MAQPLVLAAKVTLDASGVPAGAQLTRTEIATIAQEAARTENSLQKLINASMGIGSPAANSNMREWNGALAMQGRSVDELRAKYNPLFSVIDQYKASLTEIRTLNAQGVLSTDEMTAAIQRQRQAALASIEAIKGRGSALSASSGAKAFASTNAMFQFQDIGMTAAMGMSPGMIGLQQGSQLAGAYAGLSLKDAAATTGSALMGLISPTSIAAIGLTTLAASAIQYGISAVGSFDKATGALEKHDEYLSKIKNTYKAATEAGEAYGQRAQSSIAFDVNRDRLGLQKALDSGLREFSYRATPAVDASQMLYPGADIAGITTQMGVDQYGAYAEAVARFADAARSGQGDVLAFNTEIRSIALTDPGNKRLQDKAAEILTLASAATQAAEKLKELRQAELDMTLTTSRTDAARAAQKYQADNSTALLGMQRESAVSLSELAARSPSERAEAARARARLAEVDPKESPAVRDYRIEQAGTLALARAEKELADARRDRIRSMSETVESQRLELSLIGQTVSQAEALRMEYQLTTQVRAEAARNGVEVDQEELALIRAKSRAYGAMREQQAAVAMLRDQDTSLQTLRLETALVGQSEAVRRRSLALLQQEQRIQREGISTSSERAVQLRAQALLEADMLMTLERQKDAWNRVQRAGENAIDGIVDGLVSGDFEGALSSLRNSIQELATDNIKNTLKNAVLSPDRASLFEEVQ